MLAPIDARIARSRFDAPHSQQSMSIDFIRFSGACHWRLSAPVVLLARCPAAAAGAIGARDSVRRFHAVLRLAHERRRWPPEAFTRACRHGGWRECHDA